MATRRKAEPESSTTATVTDEPKVATGADAATFDAGALFGGEVNQTHNEARAKGAAPAPEAAGDAPPKRKRRGKNAEPEPVDPVAFAKSEETAAGLILTVDALMQQVARSRYAEVLTAENLDQLVAQHIAIPEASRRSLSSPLAQGIRENGLEIPWWGQFMLAGIGIMAPRIAVMAQLDKQVEERRAREAKTVTVEVVK